MQITTRHWVIIGIGFVVAIGVAFGWTHRAKAPMPSDLSVATSTTTAATSTVSAQAAQATNEAAPKSFPVNSADTTFTWSFKGSYAGNATLIAQANADIAHLTGLVGGGKYDDYDLYNGLANDYSSLGDGQMAYHYYNLAIAVHPNKGLAYANLAHLMDQLGAYETAADAYTKAVAVEQGILEYHIERLTYLMRQFPKDSSRLTAAFADASKQFGDTPAILTIEARWLASQGRYADAIKAWQTVETLSPEQNRAAIDAEIARLKAK